MAAKSASALEHNHNTGLQGSTAYDRPLTSGIVPHKLEREQHRITAATAKSHPFLEPGDLGVRVALARGKKGIGTICMGEIAEDVLQYLQNCPSWPSAVATATASAFEDNSKCEQTKEKKLAFKTEKVGIIDDRNHPICSPPDRDGNLALISSKRVA